MLWPVHYDLRRIPVRDPAPTYPHSLIWHADNPHPGLAMLRKYVRALAPGRRGSDTWAPPTWPWRVR
jgi:hypothetical protein